jgi:putative sigma-54 modulation protein
MNVTLHTHNYQLSESLETFAQQKLEKLGRYLPNIDSISVEFLRQHSSKGPDVMRAQITVRHSRGAILRAEDKSPYENANTAKIVLGGAIDKMHRRIRRFKEKPRSKRMREAYVLSPDELSLAEELPDDVDYALDAEENVTDVDVTPNGLIKRRKEVAVTAMNEDEAIAQMELLGHTFFIFFNPDTAQMQVVYKRDDGGYGLLEPHLA